MHQHATSFFDNFTFKGKTETNAFVPRSKTVCHCGHAFSTFSDISIHLIADSNAIPKAESPTCHIGVHAYFPKHTCRVLKNHTRCILEEVLDHACFHSDWANPISMLSALIAANIMPQDYIDTHLEDNPENVVNAYLRIWCGWTKRFVHVGTFFAPKFDFNALRKLTGYCLASPTIPDIRAELAARSSAGPEQKPIDKIAAIVTILCDTHEGDHPPAFMTSCKKHRSSCSYSMYEPSDLAWVDGNYDAICLNIHLETICPLAGFEDGKSESGSSHTSHSSTTSPSSTPPTSPRSSRSSLHGPPAGIDNYCSKALAWSLERDNGDNDQKAKFDRFKLKTHATPPPPQPNPHHVSAQVRRLAVATALGRIRQTGARSVCSAFGAPRDESINNYLNRDLPLAARTTLTVWRPLITVKDVGRLKASHSLDSPPAVDAYFLNDVYKADTPDQILDLSYLYNNFLTRDSKPYHKTNSLYWAGWYFNGPAGTTCDEGSWLRLTHNMVEARPDPYSNASIHGDCDWIHHDGCVDVNEIDSSVLPATYYVSWTVCQTWTLGTRFDLVAFSITRSSLAIDGLGVPPHQFVELQVPALPNWLPDCIAAPINTLASWIPDQLRPQIFNSSCFITPALLNKARVKISSRVINDTILSSIESEIKILLEQDHDTATFVRNYPHHMMGLTGILMSYVLREAVRRSTRVNRSLVCSNRDAVRANQYLRTVGAADKPTPTWEFVIKVGLGLVGLYAGLKAIGAFLRILITIKRLLGSFTKNAPKVIRPSRANFDKVSVPLSEAFTRPEHTALWLANLIPTPVRRLGNQLMSPLVESTTHFNERYVIPFVNHFVPGTIASSADAMKWRIVVAAPVVEEVFKRLVPCGSGMIGFYEVITYLSMASFDWRGALIHFFSHVAYGSLPLPQGIAFHAAHNYFCLADFGNPSFNKAVIIAIDLLCHACVHKPFAQFAWKNYKFLSNTGFDIRMLPSIDHGQGFTDTFYSAHFPNFSISDEPSTSTYPPSCSTRPRRAMSSRVDGPFCTSLRHSPLPVAPTIEFTRVTHFSLIFATNAIFHVPANCAANALAALQARLLKAPPMDPLTQLANWTTIDHFFQSICDQDIPQDLMEFDAVHPPWMDHHPPGLRRRYERAHSFYKENGIDAIDAHFDKIKIQGKWNESLIKPHDSLKPRTLSNIDPTVQNVLGPFIYEFTKRLKVNWNSGRFYQLPGGWTCSFRYAGADTDLDLSIWARWISARCISKHIDIIVSGDDSLCVIVDSKGNITIMEADASMYDQSQSFGPLRRQRRTMRHYGVPRSTTSLMKRLSKATLVMIIDEQLSPNKVKISQANRPMRQTGGSDTSVGNSYIMAVSCAFALTTCATFSATDIAGAFAFLGLDMKIKLHSRLTDATFLKGHWVAVHSDVFDLYWAPLPSRFLKFSKSCDPLPKLFPTIFRRLKSDREAAFVEAARCFLGEVCHGHAAYIKTPFVDALAANFPLRGRWAIPGLDNPYRINAAICEKPEVDLHQYFEQCARRYGCSALDVQDALNYLPTDVFQIRKHPVFGAFAKIDYN